MPGQANQWCIAPREFKSHPQRDFKGNFCEVMASIEWVIKNRVLCESSALVYCLRRLYRQSLQVMKSGYKAAKGFC